MTQNKNQNTIYLGMNNLYGCAMSKFLPTSGFKWIDPKACVCYFLFIFSPNDSS